MNRYATLTKLSTDLAWAEILGHHENAARLRRAVNLTGAEMTYNTRFKQVLTELDTALSAGTNELRIFDTDMAALAERGTPAKPGYVRDTRAKILARIREGERIARPRLGEAQREALDEATRARAAAEMARDPQQRIADEMERARLVASKANPEPIAAQAEAALKAGQPRRAEFLLATALDLGWRGGFETDPATGETVSRLPRLRQSIEDAIDAAEPDRGRARSIEESVVAASEAFSTARNALLAKHGLGVAGDGEVGSGYTSEVAHASIAAKAAALRQAQERGTFAQPDGYQPPEGALASAPTGGAVRTKDAP